MDRGTVPTHPEFRYAGAFFIGCDHSCGHGAATHGCAATDPCDFAIFNGESAGGCITAPAGRRDVLTASLTGIRATDLVFVWIDADFATAYGTLAEIGYAHALHKPI